MTDDIRALAKARWSVAIVLSAVVFVLYFGFIFAVAFAKQTMASEIVPGLSVGILAGALVIICAWLTTWAYVTWANARYDGRVTALGGKGKAK